MKLENKSQSNYKVIIKPYYYLNNEVIAKFDEVMINNLFEWLLNRKSDELNIYLDGNEKIVNPNVIDLFIHLSKKANMEYIQKVFQTIHLLLIANNGIF